MQRDLRPLEDAQGKIGTSTYGWLAGYFHNLYLAGQSLTSLFDPAGAANSAQSFATSAISTAISGLSSVYQTAAQVASAITSYGYQTAAQVSSAITSALSSYATSASVSSAISALSSVYTTTSAVASQITAYGYQTASQVTSAIVSYGYQTSAQVSSAITSAFSAYGFGTAATKNAGSALGVATLDSGGKIPTSQLPAGVFTYAGTWNASTNTPTLANGTGVSGTIYQVSTAGTVNFGAGNVTFTQNDWVIYNGSIWEVSPGNDGVYQVAGLTGAIISSSSLKTALAITESDIFGLTTDLSAKAPLASPALTGTPTAPTATGGTNTTQIATTAFVAAAISALSSIYQTAAQVTTAITSYGYQTAAQVTSAITAYGYVTLSSLLTGLSTATNTAVAATDSILVGIGKLQAQINTITSAGYQTADQVVTAITGYGYQTAAQVTSAITAYGYITLSSVLTGLSTSTSSTILATDTELVAFGKLQAQINTHSSTLAPLASPSLTGVPTAPTATAGTNTTQVATTAFVASAVAAGGGGGGGGGTSLGVAAGLAIALG